MSKKRKFFNRNDDNRAFKRIKMDYVDVTDSVYKDIPRSWTVSVAFPGSVMVNAKTIQLKTYLASQLSRACCIFNVNEIIVFSEDGNINDESNGKSDNNLFLVRLLKYMETPQYLRKKLFPLHNDFKYVGLMNPLRTPNHLNAHELLKYRDGVVLNKTVTNRETPNVLKDNEELLADKSKIKYKDFKRTKIKKDGNNDGIWEENKLSVVDIGMDNHCIIDRKLDENTRVTVKIKDYKTKPPKYGYYKGKVIKPNKPLKKDGIYWGYNVRFAKNISDVIRESIYTNGYDCVIGTSDKGTNIYDAKNEFKIPKFKHLLIVFGGPNGLQNCKLDNDSLLQKPELLFDNYINVCPFQGTKTIRTEEAVLITLSALQPFIRQNYHNS